MKIDSPVLRRLGPVPFWRGEKKCLETLGAIYRRAMDRATEILAASRSQSPNEVANPRRS